MKRILLLNPPTEGVKNTVRDLLYGCWCSGKRIAGAEFPPLSLLSLYSVLKNKSHPVLLDYQAVKWDLDRFSHLVKSFDAVIMPSSDESISDDLNLLRTIKTVNPGIKSMIFGSYCTFFPENALKHPEIDYIAIGEPEPAILELLKILDLDRIQFNDLSNGFGLKIDGKIQIKRPVFDYILDSLPIPDRTPIKDMFYFNPLTETSKWTTALTSRGCPGTCNFCSSPSFYGNKYRYNSFEWMKKEVEYLLGMGFKEIFYRDETFTVSRARLQQFTDWIIKDKIDLKWIVNVRVGTVNMDDLIRLKRAGCHTIKVGVESGSPEILKSMNKGITIQATEKLFSNCKKVGMKTHAHMMLGAPGESVDTVKQTHRFLRKIQPDTVTFNLFTPLPGTPLYNDMVEKFGLSKTATQGVIPQMRIKPLYNQNYTNLPEDKINSLIRNAYARFYFNPITLKNILLSIKSFSDFSRIMKSGVNVIDFILGRN